VRVRRSVFFLDDVLVFRSIALIASDASFTTKPDTWITTPD